MEPPGWPKASQKLPQETQNRLKIVSGATLGTRAALGGAGGTPGTEDHPQIDQKVTKMAPPQACPAGRKFALVAPLQEPTKPDVPASSGPGAG